VKCDKTSPCSNCVKSHAECVFPSPGRAPRRKLVGATKATSERETELLKRLRRLEGVVEELSGQVEIEAVKASGGYGGNSSSASPGSARKEEDWEMLLKDSGAKTKPLDHSVRVVGMDEGSANTRTWLARMVIMGEGPPKSENIIENQFGKLVITEGKSRYVSNTFWASLNAEVRFFRPSRHDTLLTNPG
jgi:hypothetical protein